MPRPYRSLSILLGGALLLAGCAQVQLDPFGRPYSGDATLPPGSQPCIDASVDVQASVVRANLPLAPAANYYAARNAEARVSYRIDAQGAVRVLAVDGASDKVFGNYARLAVADWKMRPAQRGGASVAVDCQLQVGTVFRGFEDEPAGRANR